jgi:uncharacterized protein (TIGR02145 family)
MVLSIDADARVDIVESMIAGRKLKEPGIAHWLTPNTGATNETGFTGFPVGFRDNAFFNILSEADWWSSTESDATTAIIRAINNVFEGIFNFPVDKKRGYSVRCIKDN